MRYVKELGFCPKGDGELVSDSTCIAGSCIFQTSLFFLLIQFMSSLNRYISLFLHYLII